MAFHKHIKVIALILTLSGTALASDLREQIATLEQNVQSQETVIDQYRNTLEEKTQEIEKIKTQRSAGIVSKLFLQKKLREAQAVSKELENLVKQRTQLALQLRKQRSTLLREIDGEIIALTNNKGSKKLAELQQFQKLIDEKDQLLMIQQKALLEVPEFNLSSSTEEKEDLIEKLRVIEDLQNNMGQKIVFLQSEVSEERSKQFLRNEVSHFIDEENFFGEQSFISSGLNRKDNAAKNLGALSLKGAAVDTVPTVTPPSVQPTVPSATQPTTSETVAAPVSSLSTSFQQPQEIASFETLLDQVRESVRNTDPKNSKTVNNVAKISDKKASGKNKQTNLEQNLALSEKILSELNVLHENYSRKIQALE